MPSDRPFLLVCATALALAWGLGGCAAPPAVQATPLVSPAQVEALRPADLMLLGEQHDAPEHQRIHREVIEALAARGQLAAVVVEMAEQGGSTEGLPAGAPEADVQDRLRWQPDGWPWPAYGPAVMAAVRAGVPVLGGNLPRAAQRGAMKDATLDARLDPDALTVQRELIRESHCRLLPDAQLPAMTRVQIARDLALAQTAEAALAARRDAAQVVLVLAGSGHVDRRLGLPRHLPPRLRVTAVRLMADGSVSTAETPQGFDVVWHTPALPAKDYCAELKESLKPAAKS